jgi:hypothetical protein
MTKCESISLATYQIELTVLGKEERSNRKPRGKLCPMDVDAFMRD